jgi:hypothetical protein
MEETISHDPLITLQDHPFEPGMKVFVSQTLDAQREKSLCRNCDHRTYKYERCEVATLLFDLAKKTGVSTLMRWCPYFSLRRF